MMGSDELTLNRVARQYIAALAGAAAFVLALALLFGGPDAGRRDLLYAGLLCLAAVAALRFPVHLIDKTKVSVDTALFVAAVLLLPAPLAMATAALAAALHELMVRESWEQAGFNVAQIALYVGAGGWIVHAVAGPDVVADPVAWSAPAALLAGATAMHLINTLLVAVMAALQLGKHPLAFWLDGVWLDLPEHAILVANGALLALATEHAPWLLPLLAGPAVLVYASLRRSAELRETAHAMVDAIADLSDLLGREATGHSRRVAERTRQLAERMGLPNAEAEVAVQAARLRGVGAVANDKALPSLTHGDPGRAAALVAMLPVDMAVAEAVLHQRERWDGSGAPDGLRRDAIPLPARLVAVADAFERLTNPRQPEGALDGAQAAERLSAGAGRQWDPRVVGALADLVQSSAGAG